MLKRLVTLGAAAALVLLAIGCSQDSPTNPESPSGVNLDDATGGLTTASEQPAFGDSELMTVETEEEVYDDPILLTSPEVAGMVDDTLYGWFHLRAAWGSLELDTSVTTVTDWSGTLTVSRGGIVVRRLIMWDRAQDQVLPRTDRTEVAWNSQTSIHFDGLAFDIFVPRPPLETDTTIVIDSMLVDSMTVVDTTYLVDTLPAEPVTVEFKTGPYSATWSLEELVSLDTAIAIDDVNSIQFVGTRIYRNACARGFVRGQWGYNSEGEGVFRGVWVSASGLVAGHLRGHFGVNSDGQRVLFAKWINRAGTFEGYLRGVYDPHPNANANPRAFERAGGKFRAEILDANKQPIGAVHGRYAGGGFLDRGFFAGRWKIACPERSDEDDAELGFTEPALVAAR